MTYGIPTDQPFTIRDGKPEDYAFILASWSNEAHKIKYDNFISNSIFFPRQKALINNILSKSIVKVAHLDNDADNIAGYLVMQPNFKMKTLYVHWAHTKPLYRRLGIAKGLLTDYVQDGDPILVITSPFVLLPELKKRYGILYDPSVIDDLRGSI